MKSNTCSAEAGRVAALTALPGGFLRIFAASNGRSVVPRTPRRFAVRAIKVSI